MLTQSCIRCSERKVKCNRQVPCSSCIRQNVQCIFRPQRLSRKKQAALTTELLGERLKRYEALLREMGVDPRTVTGGSEAEVAGKNLQSKVSQEVPRLPIPASATPASQGMVFKPELLHDQQGTKLINNNLWSRVAREIHEDKNDQEDESASEDEESEGERLGNDFSYVLGMETPVTTFSHPPTPIIHRLWQTFVENVNPLSKLVHVPSLQSAIEKAVANIDQIPKGFEALMFAIYSMAVFSLTEAECKELLGETRAVLLPHYVTATKAALSRARFMSSTSIVVLQALALHILSIRDTYEPHAVWRLTGVAMRISEGMGMRLDGTLLGLSPFETEIRRRIWWQLKMHDFRAGELCGQSKFRNFDPDETTPKTPANVNDSDLYPAMQQAAVDSGKPTEMMWFMLRSDLTTFAGTLKAKMYKLGKTDFTSEEYSPLDNLRIKTGIIKEMEDMIETKYLRFCDPSQPLQLMVLLGGRVSTNIIRFVCHHPRRWAHLNQVPESEKQAICDAAWDTVIRLLEQYKMMQSAPQLRRFAWNVPYFIQWHAVIHILDVLRADPLRADSWKAWDLIGALYENNSALLLDTRRSIFVAVGNLCLKAFAAREARLVQEGCALPEAPRYITRLREQRERAKAKREAVTPRSDGQSIRDAGIEASATAAPDAPMNPIQTSTISPEPPAYSQRKSQHSAIPKQPTMNSSYGTARTGDDDAFWLSDALNSDFPAGRSADMMNLDMDTILGQDYWLESPPDGGGGNGEITERAQLNAWLGLEWPLS